MSKKYALFGNDGVRITQLIGSIHAIPVDAVQISDELFSKMVQESDGIWTLGGNGEITKEPLPEVIPDYAGIERKWRDKQVESIKWIRERHRDEVDMVASTTISPAQFSELLAYIQSLRDWPESKDFPAQEKRPSAPKWIADHPQ